MSDDLILCLEYCHLSIFLPCILRVYIMVLLQAVHLCSHSWFPIHMLILISTKSESTRYSINSDLCPSIFMEAVCTLYCKWLLWIHSCTHWFCLLIIIPHSSTSSCIESRQCFKFSLSLLLTSSIKLGVVWSSFDTLFTILCLSVCEWLICIWFVLKILDYKPYLVMVDMQIPMFHALTPLIMSQMHALPLKLVDGCM